MPASVWMSLYLGSEWALVDQSTTSYISASDLIDRVGEAVAGQLTTEAGLTPDETKVGKVAEEAEGEVNGYLARLYAVPVDLSAYPELAATLRGKVLDIAVFRLFALRPPVPEEYKLLWEAAVKWLALVSKGEIVLPASTRLTSTAATKPMAMSCSSENDMNRENRL